MKLWSSDTPKSHLIAIANTLVVVATVAQMLSFDSSYWFSKLYPLFQLVKLINFPVYWAADTIPGMVFRGGAEVVAVALAFVLFVGGAYAWAWLVCLILRIDSFEVRKKK